MVERITIGSRGSQLALWQSNWVKGELEREFPGLAVKIEVITTRGDRVLNLSLPKLGEQGKGLFTKELEDAILEGRVDIAVHSLKDLPTEVTSGLGLAAICKREEVRDALVARSGIGAFEELPKNSTVGTSSLRRQAQLLGARPDLIIRPVRGNVDTRLRKLDQGEFDSVVLAAAGLHRLGLIERITQLFSLEVMLPAPGQGALAIESRADNEGANEIVASLDHRATRLECLAERAFLRGLGGGCLVPIAAYAQIDTGSLRLTGLVANPDGSAIVRGTLQGFTNEAEAIGLRLADDLLTRGARNILGR